VNHVALAEPHPSVPDWLDGVVDHQSSAGQPRAHLPRPPGLDGVDRERPAGVSTLLGPSIGTDRKTPSPHPASQAPEGEPTHVDAGVTRPLIEGLALPSGVTNPSARSSSSCRIGFDEGPRRSVAEDGEVIEA
jgi:hypothetical protein